MLLNKMRTLGESKFSGVNQGKEGGREMSKRFSSVTPGVWELPISLFAS